MSTDFRETTIRVHGVEQTIRTERTTTIKRLDTDHAKAVKAALIELRTAEYSKTFNPELATAKAIRETRGAVSSYVDARKDLPKAPYNKPVPDYMVQISPGHYATPEAAAGMGASEIGDEVLPGLEVRRQRANGTRWVLHKVGSETDEKPNGVHLGPVFKTKAKARTVATDELAGFDWTRTADQLTADELAGATVRFVKVRELVEASSRNGWAKEDLRKAEDTLKALTHTLAA